MTDPISGAIAGSVANKAIEKIVGYIEESNNPEEAWKRSVLEVAIQAEACYRQEIVAGRLHNPDKVKRELNKYGKLAQQLALRGELRGFDQEFVELIRELGDGIGEFGDRPGGLGMDPKDDWEEMVKPTLTEIKTEVEI